VEPPARDRAAAAPQVKQQLKGLRGKAAAKEADRRGRRLDARAGKLEKKLEVAREGLDKQLSAGWRTFEGLRDVLVAAGGLPNSPECIPTAACQDQVRIPPCISELSGRRQGEAGSSHGARARAPPCPVAGAGALKEGSLEAGPLGEVARQLNGSNELWLALALAAPGTSELQPPQLAALACGLVAADVRVRCTPPPCSLQLHKCSLHALPRCCGGKPGHLGADLTGRLSWRGAGGVAAAAAVRVRGVGAGVGGGGGAGGGPGGAGGAAGAPRGGLPPGAGPAPGGCAGRAPGP
jgi:DSHCT (NUC185) domain